ncbi:MAG: hypothetical protein DLM69_07830 [Candidatus Chloroheliales bacterium]|nr:MAG: hypothetical protein DLM69_07830 [Chloroflexota bacterium]
MTTSTKITWLHNPHKVVSAALQHYALNATRLAPMSSTSNAVFRVATADGDFTLRLHRFDETGIETTEWLKYITSELLWLQALSRDTDLNVPHPLANQYGELVTLIDTDEDKQVFCSALGWMEGRFYNAGLRPAHLERMGELTARLHNYSESGQFVPPPDFYRDRADALDGPNKNFEFPPMQSDVREAADYLNRLCSVFDAAVGKIVVAAIEQVWSDLGDFGMDNDRFGLIHADIHQWNYMFWQGKPKLIDFNNVGYAHYLYDFSVILNNLLDRDDYAVLRDATLQGYQRIRPLPANHRRYMRSLIALRNLQLIQWTLIWPVGSLERKQRWYDVEESLRHLRLYVANEGDW